MSEEKLPIPIWLDCDPGHDDAFAILLAAYSPNLKVLGISIVHGNDTVHHCALNAKRFMWVSGIRGIPVYPGVTRPIVRDPKYCPEIHGVPGQDGVAGLCGFSFPDVKIFSEPSNQPEKENGVLKMFEIVNNYPEKVTIVSTGAQTNLAMALRMFPNFKDNIEKIVFMGGAIGVGNTGVAAEFNIELDPEAAHIIFHSGIQLVMVPLEVTHTVLVTTEILNTIAKIKEYIPTPADMDLGKIHHQDNHPHVEYPEIFLRIADAVKTSSGRSNSSEEFPKTLLDCSSSFSQCCVQLLTFFQSTYKTVFSFAFPPLHDPSAVFYVTNPEAFKTIDVFLDVDISSSKCAGRTLCDIHNISKNKPNAKICYELEVDKFWSKMFSCLKIADKLSPLNK